MTVRRPRELLLEIGCEEMPARWLPALTGQLAARLAVRLAEARVACRTPVVAFSTPRRLGASIIEVAEWQADLEETITGPPLRAAFDEQGAPRPPAEGFARKHGVRVDALARVETDKGEYLAFHRRQRGRKTRTVLGTVLAATLRDLSFPKPMHWDAVLDDGRGEFVFGRPVRWLLFMFGGKVVPFVIDRPPRARAAGVSPVRSGDVTYGHRFFTRRGTPGRRLRVTSFADYRTQLADAYVLIDRAERQSRIARKLERCARKVGGRVAPLSQGSLLLDEVPDLVEYPAVVTGSFPPEFLSLPDEVLATTMIHHQHYFPVVDPQARLTAHFLAVTNTPRDNVARIARNAGRVLTARLRDARFFWDADVAHRLDARLDRLETLRFHRTLGSYRAKSERVARLAAAIARDTLGRPGAAAPARRAAVLCKADLATDMVGEFPELQGVMGGVYAREQGEPEEIWRAVYHHYLPVGVDADAPPSRGDLGEAAVTWAALSLADKLDTVVGLFRAGEKPTGSRDPLGLRRQVQGMLRILTDLPELTALGCRVSLGEILAHADAVHPKEADPERGLEAESRLTAFVLERLRYLLEQRGHDIRNVRAVTHQRLEVRPLDARRKLEVLPEFTDTTDFRTLATLFKRVKNIARELPAPVFAAAEATGPPLGGLLTEPAERTLHDDMSARRVVIEAAVASGTGFRAAFAEAARLGPAVDRFFTDVFVMAEDAALRRARLRLVTRVERLILQLADVSEIVQEP